MKLSKKVQDQLVKIRKQSIISSTDVIQKYITNISNILPVMNTGLLEVFNSQTKLAEFIKSKSFNTIIEIANTQNQISESLNSFREFPKLFSNINITNTPFTDYPDDEIQKLKKLIDDRDREIKILKSNIKSPGVFGVEITNMGNFIFNGKKLCITTNSKAGQFFEHSLRDYQGFVSDEYCESELGTSEPRNILRDINSKYLIKDGIKAKYERSGDSKGYVLLSVIEL